MPEGLVALTAIVTTVPDPVTEYAELANPLPVEPNQPTAKTDLKAAVYRLKQVARAVWQTNERRVPEANSSKISSSSIVNCPSSSTPAG